MAAGLALVEQAGIEGLTMRALARELDVDPMAVYRHVRDKDDLLGAMCDQLLAELDPIDVDGSWEPQVRHLAGQVRGRLVAQPALLPALAGGPVTPAGLAIARDAIELLARNGIPVPLATSGFGAIFAYVLGFAMIEAALPAPPGDSGDEVRQAVLEQLDAGGAAPPPHLHAAVELMNTAGDFDLGLDLLVDGLRRRIERDAAG